MTNIYASIHTQQTLQADISDDYIIDDGLHSFDKCDTLIAISEHAYKKKLNIIITIKTTER